MKILVVDDSKAMRSIVMRTLRQAGYGDHAISEASTGAEALGSIRNAAPDLVLCDWNMPEMSGIELLHALGAEGIRLKFGFVTSESTPEMRKIAEDGGALELAFSKKKIEERKAWLAAVEPGTFLDQSQPEIGYSDFVHRELVLFSRADLER